MNFLIDTNICSAYIKGNRTVWSRFLQHAGGMALSVITVGELWTWAKRAKTRPEARNGPSGFSVGAGRSEKQANLQKKRLWPEITEKWATCTSSFSLKSLPADRR